MPSTTVRCGVWHEPLPSEKGTGIVKRCPQCGYKEPKPVSHWRKKLGPKRGPKAERERMRNGHEYVNGIMAHQMRRAEIYRNAGGEVSLLGAYMEFECIDLRPATCQGCVEPHLIGWDEGQWHHNVKSKGGKRCDCAACGKFVCGMIHERYRNRIIP